MTKIVKLEAENIKRLRAVTIEPNGNVVVVGGKNGAGKSSTLDSIWYALGGKGAMPSEPLKHGEEKGFSKLTLDNGLVIERRVRKSGTTTLTVETAEGAVHKSPQAILDKLVGSITLDPLAFTRQTPRAQLETLRELVGLDTSELDAKRAEVYDLRTTVNRKIKELEGELASVVDVPDDTPNAEVSAAELVETLSKVEADQDTYSGRIEDSEKLDDALTELDEQIQDTKLRLKRLQGDARGKRSQLTKLQKSLGDVKATEAALATAVDEVKHRISAVDGTNANVRAKRQKAALVDRIANGRELAASQTETIEELDAEKAALLAKAKFPVKGLSFGEAGIRFVDVPFEQCSSAEQLRVSVGMALAMSPELKVLLVRDGSLLDEDSMKLLAGMAKKADAQVWVEAVSTDTDKCAVIIEDGEVRP